MRNESGILARQNYRLRDSSLDWGSGSWSSSEFGRPIVTPVQRRVQVLFAFLTLILCAVGVGVIYWWAFFDTEPPIEVVEAKAVQGFFHFGESVVVEERLQVRRICPGTVSRSIVDSAGIAYPLLLSPDPLIRVDTKMVRVSFNLPPNLGPGS